MMIKIKKAMAIAFCLPCLLLLSVGSYAQDDPSLASLKATVEAHPDSLEYHKEYIQAFRKSIPGASYRNYDSVIALLKPQYEKWMKRFPHSAAVPMAYGEALGESPDAKPYLLKAVELDPTLAEAWSDLSIDAERWGDKEASREYMLKATEAKPEDPSYAFYYAMDQQEVDPAKWRSMLYDLVKRFPDSERGAQALYWLAYDTKDPATKLEVFEQLRQLYPPAKFDWSASGMLGLFQIYLKQDPQKALEVAQSMRGKKDGWVSWGRLDTLARNFIEAGTLMKQGKNRQAVDLLSHTGLPRYPDFSSLMSQAIAKANDAAGNTKAAYDSLAVLFAKEPTEELYAAIEGYAIKLQKNEKEIKQDIREAQVKNRRPAPPFNLGLYTSGGKLSLADCRGKVVLLTFWFPGCGPCRGEFPHFQKVINEFKGKDVLYVGINVLPEQNAYVLPFLKGTGYTFIPLRGNSDWAAENYKVRGEPTNFLIDQQGRIVYSNFRIDGNNEKTLELMIQSLLAQKS